MTEMNENSHPHIPVEKTLVLIKPEAVIFTDEITEKILQNGFFVLQKRKVHLTAEQASEFYADHYGKMFFTSLVSYMSSGPIIALVVAKENCISAFIELAGPPNANKAKSIAPERFDDCTSLNLHFSLRAIYGTDDQQNAVHASNNHCNAEKEIRFFFPDTVTEPIPMRLTAKDYLYRNINPTLLKGLTEVCKQKPKDPVSWLADWLLENNPYRPKISDFYMFQKHL